MISNMPRGLQRIYGAYFGILTTKSSKLVDGEIRIETEKHDFSSYMSGLAKLVTKTANDEQTKLSNLTKLATESEEKSRVARFAILATQLAFILLCAFAIRLFSLP
jgi:hypothetical protein